ncbi:MAG: PAS domain S-box protein [Leptolyngbyaceae cyanobacterium CSU_1_3]|nr:PAS domain S-box protein [Leptolyngbyaceae cyanobacterium CSU_1_3]
MANHDFNDSLLRIGAIELSLSQSESLFRAYVEAANDMVYTVDLSGLLTYVNSYGQKLLGCPESEIVGRPYLDFVSPPFREKTARAFNNLMHTGELRDFEFVLQPRVGSEIYLEVNGRLLRRNGELIGGIGIGRDVTERKRIEKQLQMFSRAVESAYDSAVITDLRGKILYANPAASRIFSWQLGELVDKDSSVFYPERRQTQWLIQQAIAGGWSGEVLCNRRNGERFSALVSVGPICDERENTTAVSFITRDITQQKQIEAELAAKNLELERASRLKSEFLANMSHELRTPLTAILGFSSILRQQIFGALNPKQEVYIQQINHSGQHLLGLINDVLDLSKVEAGQMRLEIVPIAINELCEDALALVSEQARSRKLEVHHSLQLNLPPLMADELRVRQMLLNLLSNAIKFSQEGGKIGLDVEVRKGNMQIDVWDKGIGIPKDKQHLLFQPFQQVDGSVSRRHEGTGLGLALTRRLAELHFGRVDVYSQEGQGSRFTISLPLNHLSVDGAAGTNPPQRLGAR